MEFWGTFIDDRLDPETDFSRAVAFGLCDISANAVTSVGGCAGSWIGWFCSSPSLLRMGSVVGVLVEIDPLIHTRKPSGE